MRSHYNSYTQLFHASCSSMSCKAVAQGSALCLCFLFLPNVYAASGPRRLLIGLCSNPHMSNFIPAILRPFLIDCLSTSLTRQPANMSTHCPCTPLCLQDDCPSTSLTCQPASMSTHCPCIPLCTQVDAALDATNVARVAHYIRDKTRGLANVGEDLDGPSGAPRDGDMSSAPSNFQSIVISLKVSGGPYVLINQEATVQADRHLSSRPSTCVP